MVDQKILEAFQLMWGPFPEPVMLVHKDRTILAVNDLCRSIGTPIGIKCFSLNMEGGKTTCKRCKANMALRQESTVCSCLGTIKFVPLEFYVDGLTLVFLIKGYGLGYRYNLSFISWLVALSR